MTKKKQLGAGFITHIHAAQMMIWYNWVIIDIILEVISFWTRRNAMNFIARKNKQIRSVKGHCTPLVRSLQSTLAGHSHQVCTYNEKLIYILSSLLTKILLSTFQSTFIGVHARCPLQLLAPKKCMDMDSVCGS